MPLRWRNKTCTTHCTTQQNKRLLSSQGFNVGRSLGVSSNMEKFTFDSDVRGMSMESPSGQKWLTLFLDPDFRITSSDIIPSSKMQSQSKRTDTDLARFLPFGPVKNSLTSREIFWSVENFFICRDYCLSVENFFASWSVWLIESFVSGREFFWSVERLHKDLLWVAGVFATKRITWCEQHGVQR